MIHSLWDSPTADAPEIVRQAHRLMLKTLTKIINRVSEVLIDPQNAGGARVMSAATAALTNPKIDHPLRVAALTQLQKRMLVVDPATPKRLFLNAPSTRSTIATSIAADLEALEAFDAALERHILQTRPGTALRIARPDTVEPAETAEQAGTAEAAATAQTAQTTETVETAAPAAPAVTAVTDPTRALESLGLLLSMLVVRLGQGSITLLEELTRALASGAKPVIARHWAWLDVNLNIGGRPQLRRVLLDPATFAAVLIAHDHAADLPRPAKHFKARRRNNFYRSLARSAFLSFQKTIADKHDPAWMASLDRLCTCAVQRLQLVTMPLLASYARGDVASSSLEPGTWARLIGCLPMPQEVPPAMASEGSDDLGDAGLSGIDPGGDEDLQEQLTAGALDENGLIVELRHVMDGPRSTWGVALDAIVDRLNAEGVESETAALVVSWLRFLAVDRTSKTKMLADGSVRHYRGLIVNRLLVLLPPNLSAVDAETLEDAYLDVIQSRRSTEQTGRIVSALASFDRYVRRDHLPLLPTVDLPGFESAAYGVSNRIITEPEYRDGLRMIADGSIVLPDEAARRRLVAYWGLAFRTGTRRSEMLGLTASDVGEERIAIRKNDYRGLKTGNARRILPVVALDAVAIEALRALDRDEGSDAALFFDHAPSRTDFESAAVIGHAKLLLKRVAGDADLTAHNLRHSIASLHLIGVLGKELRLRSHPCKEPWMEAAIVQAERVDAAISGELHRKAGRGNALSMLLGHGSELTTFEHYCHGFDLLLYVACWSGRFDPRARRPERHLHPLRQETSQLLALLGYAETTRVETGDASALLMRIADRRPGGVVILEKRPVSHPHEALSADPASPSAPAPTPALPTLNELIDWDPLFRHGHPRLQSQRDLAVGMHTALSLAYRDRRDAVVDLISDWSAARSGGSDWATMQPDDARRWVASARSTLPRVPIEVQHQRKTKRRRTIKTGIRQVRSPRDLRSNAGIWFVRLGDIRGKASPRSPAGSVPRSHSQATITWLMVQLDQWVRTSFLPCGPARSP